MDIRSKTIKAILIAASAIAALAFTSVASADLVVIVNKNQSISSINKNELGRIFLGKASAFSDGSKAIPINQVFSSDARKMFDSNMLKRSESQMKSYWSKMMFSGEGTPPEEMNGDLNVLQRIMSDANAIGYIDSSAVNDAVKVLSVN